MAAKSAEPRSSAWERIFTEKIQHEDGCPFEHGDANGDGHVECECYVTMLWDAIVDEIDGRSGRVCGRCGLPYGGIGHGPGLCGSAKP
jgi:hypothetical protein